MEAIRSEEQIMETARAIVSAHAAELSIRRKQLTHKLNYGLMDDSKWQSEMDFFIEKKIETRIGDVRAALDRLHVIRQMIIEATAHYDASRIPFTNEMDPVLYEHLVADTLKDFGWDARLTKGSGDQGVDVIAARDDRRIVIQCKRYSKAIGNAAVQEAIAGMAFERAERAVVVSNAGYTRSARQLADSAGVILLHHDELPTLWSRISESRSVSQERV